MSIDVMFFKPFIDGTQLTLKVQGKLESKSQKPYIKRTGPKMIFDIAGIIGITSSTVSGSIAICFPKPVYLTLLSNMLGETFTEITDEMQDGAAEVMNMIYGHAKKVLNDQGHDLQKAIPTVIRGTNIQTQHLSNEPVIVIPFETSAGIFYVEIAIDLKNSKTA